MKIYKRHLLRSPRFRLTSFLALIILVGALTSYVYMNGKSESSADGINYSPATEVDKTLNNQHKQELADQTTSDKNGSNSDKPDNTSATASKASVKPFITTWGQPDGQGGDFKLNGYVPEIIETDGVCTLSLRKSDVEIEASKAALRNAQNTSCGQMSVDYDRLSPGEWQAVLSYSSSSSVGSSNVTVVEIK